MLVDPPPGEEPLAGAEPNAGGHEATVSPFVRSQKQPARHLPGARRGESRLAARRRVEDLRAVAFDVGADGGLQPDLSRPAEPGVGVHPHDEVREAVAQGGREGSDDGLVLLEVAGGEHDGLGVKPKLADPPFQHDLVGRRLMELGDGGVDLVEKEEARALGRFDGPARRVDGELLGLAVREPDPAEIRRITLREADVDEGQAEVVGQGRRQRRLAHARVAAQQDGDARPQAGRDERVELRPGIPLGSGRGWGASAGFDGLHRNNSSSWGRSSTWDIKTATTCLQ